MNHATFVWNSLAQPSPILCNRIHFSPSLPNMLDSIHNQENGTNRLRGFEAFSIFDPNSMNPILQNAALMLHMFVKSIYPASGIDAFPRAAFDAGQNKMNVGYM